MKLIKTRIENKLMLCLILIILLVFGAFYIFFIPPFQKPDETLQFYRSVGISLGNISCQIDHSGKNINRIPNYLFSFPNDILSSQVINSHEIKIPTQRYLQIARQKVFDQKLVAEEASCPLQPFSYLPQAFGQLIPVHLNLNPFIVFYSGRLAIFIFCFAVLLLTLFLLPFELNLIVLTIWSMPTFMNQIASYSKDAVHLSLGLLAFALFINLRNKFSLNKFLTLLVSIFAVIMTRIQYLPMILIPIILLMRQKNKVKSIYQAMMKNKIIYFVSFITLIFLMSVVLTIFYKNYSTLTLHPDNKVPVYQFQNILKNPGLFVDVLNKTIENNYDFYYKSAIGILGYLDYKMNWFVYAIYLVIFALLIFKNSSYFKNTKSSEFLTLSFILVSVILTIFLSFYLYQSRLGSAEILGLQGRYFILLIPYLIWLISFLIGRLGLNKIILISISIIFVSFLANTYDRYYNHELYYYPDNTINVPSGDKSIKPLNIIGLNNSFVAVDKNKKIRGISVYLKKLNQHTYPLLLTVKDDQCKNTLSESIVDVTKLQSKSWNYMLFPVLKTKVDSLCINISQIKININPPPNLTFGIYNSQLLIAPIYLY